MIDKMKYKIITVLALITLRLLGCVGQERAISKAESQAPIDYGRIIYTGDSRSVDMFDGSREEIRDEVHDGILVHGLSRTMLRS